MNQQAPIAILPRLDDSERVDAYWRAVSETLHFVLNEAHFSSIADSARARLEGASAETQLLFYHASPFQVAADLAGVTNTELDASDFAAYREIIERFEPGRFPPPP